MPVRAREIIGFLPEKKKGPYGMADFYGNFDEAKDLGRNQAIDQMSNRSLGLNREKLLLIVKEAYSDYRHGRVSPDKSGSEHIVNEIISQEHNLLESKDKTI